MLMYNFFRFASFFILGGKIEMIKDLLLTIGIPERQIEEAAYLQRRDEQATEGIQWP